MRIALLSSFLFLSACAHGGDGKPDYCSHPFFVTDPALDLDHDGIVAGTDFAIYRKICGHG